MAAKNYVILGSCATTTYPTYEAAEVAAKRYVGASRREYGVNEMLVYGSVASVNAPVPEAVVTKFV